MNEKRLVNQMTQDGIDALIASTPENVGYLTNFWTFAQQAARGVQTYTLISSSIEKPVLIVPIGDVVSGMDLIEPKELTMIPYGSFYIHTEGTTLSETDQEIKEIFEIERSINATEALITVIKEENLGCSVIGIENEMPFQALNRLKKEFPQLRIREATDLLHKVRMVKTDDEIEKLKKSADIIEKAINAVLHWITEGTSEIEAAKKLKGEIIREGAEPGLTNIGFGANSAHPDALPCGNRLKKADIVRFDVGCIWKHYYSDTARAIVFGEEATTKQNEYYNAIANGQRNGIAKATPGTKVSDIFDLMMKTVRKDIPHYNRHHCGHGIGLEIHQPPSIAPSDNSVLEKGMVINLEVPYYELGLWGLQVEDTVLITEKGNEVMTTVDETLHSWGQQLEIVEIS